MRFNIFTKLAVLGAALLILLGIQTATSPNKAEAGPPIYIGKSVAFTVYEHANQQGQSWNVLRNNMGDCSFSNAYSFQLINDTGMNFASGVYASSLGLSSASPGCNYVRLYDRSWTGTQRECAKGYLSNFRNYIGDSCNDDLARVDLGHM